MNERNIENLKARLMQLGFAASVEMELRCRICFGRAAFELVHRETAGADVARFAVRVERAEKGQYDLLYYQASLRKEISVPGELLAIDMKMSEVNWKVLTGDDFEQVDKASVLQASELLKELGEMGSQADVLKFKYWVDTPLEIMMSNIASLKNRYEISERFYLVDEAHVISFSEAGRFLRAKWMERQVVASKKLLVKKNEGDHNGGGGNGKLLLKKSRSSSGKGLIKKA